METKRVSVPTLKNSQLIETDNKKLNSSTFLKTSDAERPPILSMRGSKDYNRLKYYSAIRTSYKHLTPETKDSFLNPPTHIIN
jgi:hypothetical protein